MNFRKGKIKSPYQGTVTLDEWERILNDLHHSHWRKVLARQGIGKRRWFEDKSKSFFYELVQPPEYGCFLDVGAGSGVISAQLAKRFQYGIALEFFKPAVRFMRTRFHQDHIENIFVLAGNGLHLPLSDKNFDLVVVNGVLEWVAEAVNTSDCRLTQIAFLKEIYRCLKPGGKLALAIENRWSLAYLRGGSPHGEPPFVALLPRGIANTVHRMMRGGIYRNYIYGYKEYEQLMKEAGYNSCVISLAVPNYFQPEDMWTPAQVNSSEVVRLQRSRGKKRGVLFIYEFLRRLGILHQFWPAFFIQAER